MAFHSVRKPFVDVQGRWDFSLLFVECSFLALDILHLRADLLFSRLFLHLSSYVEQLDIQSPQLTVRETVLFSARLRLDANKVKTDEEKQKFCDLVIKMLELTPLKDSLIGSAEEGGLSFEQKKRVSIAVELAASPSVLFLDEVCTASNQFLFPFVSLVLIIFILFSL